jgi:hypothetical protein
VAWVPSISKEILEGVELKKNIGEQKAIKLGYSKRVEEIDSIAEKRLLSMDEWEERIGLEDKLMK